MSNSAACLLHIKGQNTVGGTKSLGTATRLWMHSLRIKISHFYGKMFWLVVADAMIIICCSS